MDWGTAQLLIEAARGLLLVESERLEDLLRRSDECLAPLSDPLDTDFGLHRWLESAREESYSDWLEWIVRQVERPDLVFRLFGIRPPDDVSEWLGLAPEMLQREVPVAMGEEGRAGRLDLIVRYRDRASIVIEVKLTRTDVAATKKQKGYKSSVEAEVGPGLKPSFVLLALDSEEPFVEGFEVRRWRDFCLALRRMIPGLRRRKGVVPACMALAFAGAVEQNVLELPSQPLKKIKAGRLIDLAESISYLEEFLNGMGEL
ncbi:MAG: hypothetical protein HY236_04655 [Acidobacteria bacterium]|nr:hypothetical protein [Acidobacteriota bacterium]